MKSLAKGEALVLGIFQGLVLEKGEIK